MFCKVGVDTELVNTEPLLLEEIQGWKAQLCLVTHKDKPESLFFFFLRIRLLFTLKHTPWCIQLSIPDTKG